ncbi:MAG: hypothetical protein ACHQFX_04645 [Chitinophagales bacterium]
MKKILAAAAAVIFIASCSSDGSAKNGLPEKPGSVKSVQDDIKGKKYKTNKVGTHSRFSTDTTIQWLEPKKEEEFEKKIVDESRTFQLEFVNDTAVTIMMKDKTYHGTYIVNDTTKEDEKPGVKLRISYFDEEFRLGEGSASMVTYTYVVEGMNDKSLLLQTPRSMNDRKIVVLMNKQ